MRFSSTFLIVTSILSLASAVTFIPTKSRIHIVKESINQVLSLRGGVIEDVPTLQGVEDIIMKASAEGKAVVIDFSATWCGPCKMISPLYHELSGMEEFKNVVFLKVDVDENPETAAKYGVSSMPTFVFIKSGEVIDTMSGANPGKLKEMIEDIA